MKKNLLASLMSLTILITPAFAKDKVNFSVSSDMHVTNKVTFTSGTTLVTFSGSTNNVSGNALVNFDDLSSSSGEIKVNLSSLDTGIEKRNEHMRSVLNTNSKPFAVFKLSELKTTLKKLPAGKSVFVNALGDLTINGITKPLRTVIEFTYLPETDRGFRAGNWIMLKTDFDIKLRDFGVEPPGIVPLKVNNKVSINIIVMGKGN